MLPPLMDLGFVGSAVALRDSPADGADRQVAPVPPEDHEAMASLVQRVYPATSWAARGLDRPIRPTVRHALAEWPHVRLGLEEAVAREDGGLAADRAELAAWAATVAAGPFRGCRSPHPPELRWKGRRCRLPRRQPTVDEHAAR